MTELKRCRRYRAVRTADLPFQTVVEPDKISVKVDVKPNHCPNWLNGRGRGPLQVAVAGTMAIDVTTIDPNSLRLMGVSPSGAVLRDRVTPYSGSIQDPPESDDCSAGGRDGRTDLSLTFDSRAVVAALGTVADGEVRIVTLTGSLYPAYGGTPIEGHDVVRIRLRGRR